MSAPDANAIVTAQRVAGIDPASLPRHVAVIMDGNGRWAQARRLLRVRGHRKGVDAVRATVTECAALGIPWLTLYAFSMENWRRPQKEVDVLMDLLCRFLVDEMPTLLDNGIRLRAIGEIDRLPTKVQEQLQESIARTATGCGMELSLALSYGGRQELVMAMQRLARDVQAGILSAAEIDMQQIQERLYAPQAPDVDVVIRSAGEQRLSNFLPWQSVYAEYVTLSELWPDIGAEQIRAALREFQGRQRRFGGIA